MQQASNQAAGNGGTSRHIWEKLGMTKVQWDALPPANQVFLVFPFSGKEPRPLATA